MSTPVTTLGLLVASNVFMTAAWYGHLRFKEAALWKVIVVFLGFSWLYLGEVPRWNESLALVLILAAVIVATLPAR